jgi:hypothetical protein
MQTDSPKADPPKRKRRWFQYSLRTLLIFTLVCAVASAWLANKMEQKRKERDAVTAIVKSGGHVYYDSDIQGKDWYARMRVAGPRGPEWLRKLLGENFFSDVELVSLIRVKDAEEALINVRGLTEVERLTICQINFTDADLAKLIELPQLRA